MQFRLDRDLTILVATGMVCATVLLFGLFIWPTPYQYDKETEIDLKGRQTQTAYKINRFTGNAQWIKPAPFETAPTRGSGKLTRWQDAPEVTQAGDAKQVKIPPPPDGSGVIYTKDPTQDLQQPPDGSGIAGMQEPDYPQPPDGSSVTMDQDRFPLPPDGSSVTPDTYRPLPPDGSSVTPDEVPVRR